MEMEIKLFIAGVIFLVAGLFMKVARKKKPDLKDSKVFRTAYEWVETIWSAVLLAALIMYFIVQAFKIPSGSMMNTLLIGDHLFVNKFAYGFQVPFSGGRRVLPLFHIKRGNIIVFRCPPEALTPEERRLGTKKDFIKRAMGLPGDTVEIINKRVLINGKPPEEPYVHFEINYVQPRINPFAKREDYQKSWEQGRFTALPIKDNFGPVVVPPGNYFVMGDNRDKSFDSRFWGPLADKYIKGKALFVYWPPLRIGLIK
jgi:signal peptidase I